MGEYGARTHVSVSIQFLGIPRSFSYSTIAIRGLRTTTPLKDGLEIGVGRHVIDRG